MVTPFQTLKQYNVVWDSPSQNAAESMPCGGGDIGLNVWVENGDILFYIARSGVFDENNTLPKLGRVRLKCSPNAFTGAVFRQELDLETGSITISGQNGTHTAAVHLWVDVFAPVIQVEVASNQPIKVEAIYENWRFADRVLENEESFGNSYKWAPPAGLKAKKDEISFQGDAVVFYHRNTGETVFDVTVRQQQMEAVKPEMFDPLKNLTFGGQFMGDYFTVAGNTAGRYLVSDYQGWKLTSKTPAETHTLQIYLHTGQYETQAEWDSALAALIAEYQKRAAIARTETWNWWHTYWSRSFICIGPENKAEAAPEWQVGRNYQLFRYMLGCNAYGTYPTKFNGGLFTYDSQFTDPTRRFNADFRNWGGGIFTAQNQRLVYFPLFKSGDFELLKPQLDFYRRTLKNAELRSQVYWEHNGACFTEQIENFGLPNCSEYGWTRPAGYDPGMQYNAWLEYLWDTVLEFGYMALLLHQYAEAEIADYIPLIESCLTFFDEHYRYLAEKRGTKTLDENGHLVLYPGSGAETYKMAYNATSTIAALKTVTEGLLALPDYYLNADKRQHWQGFLQKLPPLSFRECDGHQTIAPAQLWERVNNIETPQLYPVYPWGLYGVGKPGLEVAVNTYQHDPDVQKFKDHSSWKQHNIFAARLGLTEEAARLAILKLQDSGRRFSAFWGPGFDWVPDHNWGGSGMIGLQEMLLQTNGAAIYLFPAWPKNWEVHFKLHAPQNTWIEAELKAGKVRIIHVEPEARRKD
ncbi:MAG TPA: DUF5703 domain-containing protein, partial [Phototrophicaceae bacterium]|nr:DUF5703 domain-containing protein [Phototrophicaceae bacterium]